MFLRKFVFIAILLSADSVDFFFPDIFLKFYFILSFIYIFIYCFILERKFVWQKRHHKLFGEQQGSIFKSKRLNISWIIYVLFYMHFKSSMQRLLKCCVGKNNLMKIFKSLSIISQISLHFLPKIYLSSFISSILFFLATIKVHFFLHVL